MTVYGPAYMRMTFGKVYLCLLWWINKNKARLHWAAVTFARRRLECTNSGFRKLRFQTEREMLAFPSNTCRVNGAQDFSQVLTFNFSICCFSCWIIKVQHPVPSLQVLPLDHYWETEVCSFTGVFVRCAVRHPGRERKKEKSRQRGLAYMEKIKRNKEKQAA